jgi:hypothetical protein
MTSGSPGSPSGAMRDCMPGCAGISVHSEPQRSPITGGWGSAMPVARSKPARVIVRPSPVTVRSENDIQQASHILRCTAIASALGFFVFRVVENRALRTINNKKQYIIFIIYKCT